MVNSNDIVSIVISDITRPTPNHILVPLLIEELNHVPRENFVIINGTGTHRDQTRDELIQMLGEDIVNSVKIVHNHCSEKESLAKVGHSQYGCDVYLNKAYVEMIGDPRSTWGNLEDNPVQDMAREVNRMCKPDFLLNVALNKSKEITAAFAGEILDTHKEGCAYVKDHAMFKCEQRFDIVIASNSGYPLDQNLYQTVKGMSAASKVVKKDGHIIMVSECADGFPDHGKFAEIFKMADTPQGILELIHNPNFKEVEHRYGRKLTIGVMPQGPLTIPYVEDKE